MCFSVTSLKPLYYLLLLQHVQKRHELIYVVYLKFLGMFIQGFLWIWFSIYHFLHLSLKKTRSPSGVFLFLFFLQNESFLVSFYLSLSFLTFSRNIFLGIQYFTSSFLLFNLFYLSLTAIFCYFWSG